MVQSAPCPLSLKRDGFYLLEALLSCLEARFAFPKAKLGQVYRYYQRRLSTPAASEGDNGYPLPGSYLALSGPAALCLGILARVDFAEVVLKRRENYCLWLEALSSAKGLRFLYDSLPDGVCPQVCPVVVEDVEAFAETMQRSRVAVFHWPHLPREIRGNSDYPVANFLARHLFALPVHQDVDRRRLWKAAHLATSTGLRPI